MSWPETWARLRLGDVLHRVEEKIDPQAGSGLSHYFVGLEDIESHTGTAVWNQKIEVALS